MTLPRVLLADDYPEMLDRVTQLLRGEFDIVGSAHDGGQALEAATRLNPDLLIPRNGCATATAVFVLSVARKL